MSCGNEVIARKGDTERVNPLLTKVASGGRKGII